MITEVYFIEGYYLYTQIGSRGRGLQISQKGATGAPSGMPVYIQKTLRKGSAECALIAGNNWTRQPYARSVDLPFLRKKQGIFGINYPLRGLVGFQKRMLDNFHRENHDWQKA